MTNEAQIAHWAGEGGEQWVKDHDRYDRMLAPFGRHVLEALAPAPGERVLDVGCGNGALTLDVAERVGADGSVVGVDISTPMLGLARQRAVERGVDHVTFVDADAQVHRFDDGSFDAVVSRFGVMFFDDPKAAFSNLASALRPGGRVAFACWREMLANEWIMVPVAAALEHVPAPPMGEPGAPGPFGFGDADRVRDILASAGLRDVELREIDELERIAGTVDEALRFLRNGEMGRTLMASVDDDVAAAAWSAVARVLGEREGLDGIVLGGAAWLVTARRP